MPVCHGHDAGYARAETLCVEAGSVKLGDGNKGAVARQSGGAVGASSDRC